MNVTKLKETNGPKPYWGALIQREDLQVLATNSDRIANKQLRVPLGTFNPKLKSHIFTS